MDTRGKIRNILYIAIGTGGLLFSRHYSGPMGDFFHCHGANVSISFALYYLSKSFRLPLNDNKLMNAAYAMVVVSAQEAPQGIGLYPGAYDPLDFLADAAGIGFALGADISRSRKKILEKEISESPNSPK